MRAQAFTLIEFLIALSVGAILIMMAAPSVERWVDNTRVRTTLEDVEAAFRYARQEAISRGYSVSVCPQASDYTSCGSDWTAGWLVFPNENEDSTFSNNDDEPLLRQRAALPESLSLSTSPLTSVITFNSRGFLESNTVAFMLSSSSCLGSNAFTINVLATGRVNHSPTTCP